MKKKLFSLLLSILLISTVAIHVSAKAPFVNDYANLLSSDQRQDLSNRSATFNENYGLDIVILTAPDIYGKSAQAFADDFYDNNSYGEDGILFLLDMAERQWHISTAGTAIDAISDNDLIYIEDEVIPFLSQGQYYEAFVEFYNILPGCLTSDEESSFSFGFSLFVSFVISAITILIMRSSMNTNKPQHSADNYQNEGSFHLRQHQDLFLYSNISKRPRPQDNDNSSTHRGSSGRSHGGRGGSF